MPWFAVLNGTGLLQDDVRVESFANGSPQKYIFNVMYLKKMLDALFYLRYNSPCTESKQTAVIAGYSDGSFGARRKMRADRTAA